jgi:hypothetical protein
MSQSNPKNEMLNKLFDEILTLPKFQSYTEEKKTLLKEKLLKEYNDRINKVIVVNIPINKAEEFLHLLESKDINQIDKFIIEHIPNIDDLLEAETSKFIQQLILKGNEDKSL